MATKLNNFLIFYWVAGFLPAILAIKDQIYPNVYFPEINLGILNIPSWSIHPFPAFEVRSVKARPNV